MELGVSFYLNSVLLGVGLAMDAFSVSLANGLRDPGMKPRKICGIALVFALFQAAMPLIGWACIHTIVRYFGAFEKLTPWIAMVLLGFLGGKMVRDGLGEWRSGDRCDLPELTLSMLLVQGVATSIDALSVGFTIADYDLYPALLAVALIAAVTFVICFLGVLLGKKLGTRLSGKAGVLGGVILIAIGLEIWITSFL